MDPPRQRILQQINEHQEAINQLVQLLANVQVDDPEEEAPRPAFQVGDRVEITRRDKYHGRRGIIISAHGRCYWNIRLDRLPNDTMSHIIFKAPSSLRRLD